MPARFEIVPPPVETRMQEELRYQAMSAIASATRLLNSIESGRNGAVSNARTLLNDDAFVTLVVSTGVKLVMPSSLPGFLLLLAIILRIIHFMCLRFAANRAVSNQNKIVNSKSM